MNKSSNPVIATPRRSDKLTDTEFLSFKNLAESFLRKADAAEHFGFSVVTLDAITLKKGQGSPDSIEKIRQKINTKEA